MTQQMLMGMTLKLLIMSQTTLTKLEEIKLSLLQAPHLSLQPSLKEMVLIRFRMKQRATLNLMTRIGLKEMVQIRVRRKQRTNLHLMTRISLKETVLIRFKGKQRATLNLMT